MAWPIARVGDLAEQIRGVTFGKPEASSAPAPGLIPVMTATNITEHGLVLDSVLHIPEARVSTRQRLRKNDIVITASSGSVSVVGRAVLVRDTPHATFGAFCKVLRPSDLIDPNYLAHFFRTRDYRTKVAGLAAGANINNLRNEDLDDLEVPLPPLPEQRRIASILDMADGLNSKRRRALTHLETLADAMFVDAFSSRDIGTRPLGEVAQFFAGNSLPAGEVWDGQEHGVLLIKVSDMSRPGNERALSGAALWSAIPGPVASTAPAGSVVIPKRGGAISTNRKRVLARSATLDPNLMAIAPGASYHTSAYLLAWFHRLDLTSLASGSSVPQLNKQDLAPLKIPVPSLDDQVEFGARVAALEELRIEHEAHLAKLDELFASLQYRAFRGEL